MQWTEVLITGVEPTGSVVDIGADAAKKLPPGSRHRYKQALKYTLEDGRVVEGEARARTKPLLKEAIENRHLYVTHKKLRAAINADGTLSHTIVSVSPRS